MPGKGDQIFILVHKEYWYVAGINFLLVNSLRDIKTCIGYTYSCMQSK